MKDDPTTQPSDPERPAVSDERTCIFCHREGEPLTREHVVPQWLARVLMDMEPDDIEQAWDLHYEAGGLVERDRQHPTSMPTVVVVRVCRECNNGWMSALEVKVKPVLEALVRGKRVTLTTEQQVDIATWASKTVIALEYHEPDTAISVEQDRHLVRQELRPPHHHKVRLAYRDEMTESLIIKALVARSDDAPDELPNVFATLLAIGFLLIQVWGGHGADTGPGLKQPGTKVGRAIMIWPPTEGPVEWPPVTPIPETDLDDLAREVINWADDSPDLTTWRRARRGD